MTRSGRSLSAMLVLALLVAAGVRTLSMQVPAASPETRGIAYLAREVPRWRQEHPCYSCHNNGDGTRALAVAARAGLIAPESLREESAWLQTPERWALNSDAGGVKDLPLARIQFASALRALVDAGEAQQAELQRAAALVMADQQPDGSWPITAASVVGTPSGYGTTLATAIARRVLLAAGDERAARSALDRSAAWLRAVDVQSVFDASAVLMGLDVDDQASAPQRARALDVLRGAQAPDGGWGPYATSQSEPFDTSLAVLALMPERRHDQAAARAVARARAYLLDLQLPDGSWPETTRPPGQESYSQRVSTTAWAVVAVLESRD